jgi:hypothetical protein
MNEQVINEPVLVPCFQGELQLLSWSETHNGGAKITLQLSDKNELETFKLMTLKKGNIAGQRLATVMIQIGDDEQPVTSRLSQQAALLCKGSAFQQFVESTEKFSAPSGAQRELQAIDFLRRFCGITSRAELDSDGKAGMRYQLLLSEFRNFNHPSF